MAPVIRIFADSFQCGSVSLPVAMTRASARSRISSSASGESLSMKFKGIERVGRVRNQMPRIEQDNSLSHPPPMFGGKHRQLALEIGANHTGKAREQKRNHARHALAGARRRENRRMHCTAIAAQATASLQPSGKSPARSDWSRPPIRRADLSAPASPPGVAAVAIREACQRSTRSRSTFPPVANLLPWPSVPCQTR